MSTMFGPDGKPRIDRRVLAVKAAELDTAIRRLGAIREGLMHASVCRAPSHMECPTFQRILRAAASGKLGNGDIPHFPRNKPGRARAPRTRRLLQRK
jgi:hypothetical protein